LPKSNAVCEERV